MTKKVAYLFGAGATHAEYLLANNTAKGKDDGLTNAIVSKSVIKRLQGSEKAMMQKLGLDEKTLETPADLDRKYDVELLVSLLENRTESHGEFAKTIRAAYKKEIEAGLSCITEPLLYSGLIELTETIADKEDTLGYITLNYDSVIDGVLKSSGGKIDYSNNLEGNTRTLDAVTLLKLHGSFDWRINQNKVTINASEGDELWIPPGVFKQYAGYPFNRIWGRATEILTECRTLRIIGCSLSQNDIGLLSMLSATRQLGAQNNRIELISGFTSKAGAKPEIESVLERLSHIMDFDYEFDAELIKSGASELSGNSFLDWLIYKINTEKIDYSSKPALKKVVERYEEIIKKK